MSDTRRDEKETITLPTDSIVLRAALNRALLSPAWLAKVGIIPKGQSIELGLPALYGERYLFRTTTLVWSVGDNELAVYGDPTEASRFVRSILDLLPHTPVTAAGVNTRLTIDDPARSRLKRECDTLVGFPTQDLARLMNGQAQRMSFSVVIGLSAGVLATVTVATTVGETMEATFNFHFASDDARKLAEHVNRAGEFCGLVNSLLG